MLASRAEEWGKLGEYNLPVLNFGELMCSVLTLVYLKVAKMVKLKCAHHQKGNYRKWWKYQLTLW